jgi:hypothetical protein
MQKVEGSSPFIRFWECPAQRDTLTKRRASHREVLVGADFGSDSEGDPLPPVELIQP